MSTGLLPEHEIYKKLVDGQIPHVATLEAFHDIDEQVTQTDKFQWKTWVKFLGPRRFRKFQHYRPVFQDFARFIQSFRNVGELIQAFWDALEGTTLF